MYTTGNPSELIQLARDYRKRREHEILDVTSVAANVSMNSILSPGLEPETNPLLLKAFKLQYPNVDIKSLSDYSNDHIQGFVNGVKGKYFEVLVEQRLNAGESLGELALGLGQIARIAESPTQAGWDLEIINPDGSIAEAIQLKATNSLAYIKEALERYPNIRVATPLEIDGAAEEILQTDISLSDLEQITRTQMAELSEDAFADALHQAAEWGFDALPIFPALVIAVTEGGAYLLGRSSMEEALQRGLKRMKRATVFSALGATLTALDAGFISVPTTVAAQITWSRIVNRMEMGDFIQARSQALRLLTAM